jgi:DNA-binding NarL/FixJ family response regulator
MEAPVINIGIVDDHNLFRKALSQIIKTFKHFKVIIEAENGLDFLSQMETAPQQPDVCLMDINMPKMNGYETLQHMKRNGRDIKVLAVSMYRNDYSIVRMLRHGASGYLSKNCTPEELRRAILSIYYTGHYNSDDALTQPGESVGHTEFSEIASITEKEATFLNHCCTEMNYAQIAETMGLSIHTIEGYRDVLFKKLNVKTRVGLVAEAFRAGIISRID